jgi:DNA repair exonuclease SbcCD ATPase subunit
VAEAQQRRAFLVATDTYEHLRNSSLGTEAFRKIAEGLRRNGFEVAEALDDRSSVIRAKFARFARRVRDDDVVLFILAGHMLSTDRGALYLPREIEVREDADVFRRAITLRTFMNAASRGGSGLVLMLSTNPELAAQSSQLSPYPTNIAPPPGNVVLAFSSSRGVPVSRIDYSANKALERLVRVMSGPMTDGNQLAEAVAGDDTGTIFGGASSMRLSPEAGSGRRTAGPATGADSPSPNGDGQAGGNDSAARRNGPPWGAIVPDDATARYREEIERQARLIAELRKDVLTEQRAREAAEGWAAGAREEAGAAERAAEQRAAEALKAKRATEAEAERQRAEMSKRLAALTERANEAERLRKAAEAQRSNALASLRGSAREAEDRARAAEQELRAQQDENTKLANEVARLEKVATASDIAAERWMARSQELEERLAVLESGRAAEASTCQAAEARAVETAAKLRDVEARIAKINEAKASIETELRNQIAAAQKRAQDAGAVRDSLVRRLRQVEGERDKLKAQAHRVAAAEAGLRDQIAAGEKRAQEAEALRDSLEKRLRQAEEERDGLKANADRVAAVETQLREQIAAGEKRAQEAEAVRDSLAQRLSRAKDERGDLEAKADRIAAIEAELRDRIAAGEKRAQEAETVRDSLEQRLRQVEDERDELKAKADRVAAIEAKLEQEEQARKSAEAFAEKAAEKIRQADQRVREAESLAQTAAEHMRIARAEEAEARTAVQQSAESAAQRIEDAERRAREAEAFAQIAAESARAAQSQAVLEQTRLRDEVDELRKRLARAAEAVPVTSGDATEASGPDASAAAVAPLRRIEDRLGRERKALILARLKEQGFLGGEAACAFGPDVRSAIAKFQASIGAGPTGYLTPVELGNLLAEGSVRAIEARNLPGNGGDRR